MGLDVPEVPSKKARMGDKLAGNKNASKETKTIYLGWINDGKTVRLKRGGGCRKVIVPKNIKKDELITESKYIFADGIKDIGDIDKDFNYDILDYTRCSMPDNLSVADIYEKSNVVGYVRFYLSSEIRKEAQSDDILSLEDSHMETDTNR